MLLQLVAALRRELEDDAFILLVETVAKYWLQLRESVVDVVGDVVEDRAIGVITAECKQMWLPTLWVDGFLGRPVVAQSDVGDVRIGVGRYCLKFVVGVVEWPELLSHLGSSFGVVDDGVV